MAMTESDDVENITEGKYAARRDGSFRKLGVPYFGVLIIRILLFMVLY